MRAVQLDYRRPRSSGRYDWQGHAPTVGDPIRIGLSGVEIEGVIAKVADNVLHVKATR